MSKRFFHDLQFIHWAKEADFILLSNQEYAKKLEKYKQQGTWIEEKTRRFPWISSPLPYRQDKIGKYNQLFTYEPELIKEGKKPYRRYSTNVMAGGKVVNPGRDAYNSVVNRLKEQTGKGREVMSKIFGHSDEELKRCIPKQFYHINERFTGHKVVGVGSIDFCSHFPSNLCGRLPDANTAIVKKGTVEPSEAYPFAFYIKSGHSAEHGRYDTHKWLQSVFAFRLFEHKAGWDWNIDIDPAEDQTILMQPATEELTEIMQYFYSRRKDDPVAKLVMNAFIGYLHKDINYDKNPYAHIAAVCLARANQRMLDKAEEIGFDNIIQICVDGCIYRGSKEYGGHEKGLGLIEQEYTGCIIQIESTNKYLVVDKDGNTVKFKVQGCNYLGDTPIHEDYIPTFDDLKKLNRRVILE